MELLEWMDLKYEAYLSQVELLKHEKIHMRGFEKEEEKMKGLRMMMSDQQTVMDSLKKKIEQLKQIEEILGRIEERTGDQRQEVEKDVEEIQVDLQKLQINRLVSEIKYS